MDSEEDLQQKREVFDNLLSDYGTAVMKLGEERSKNEQLEAEAAVMRLGIKKFLEGYNRCGTYGHQLALGGAFDTCEAALSAKAGAELLEVTELRKKAVGVAILAMEASNMLLAHLGPRGHISLYDEFCRLQTEFLKLAKEVIK